MLSEEEQDLMAQCNQISMKSTKIAELTNQNGFIVGTNNFDIWISPNSDDNLIILNGKFKLLLRHYVFTINYKSNPTNSMFYEKSSGYFNAANKLRSGTLECI